MFGWIKSLVSWLKDTGPHKCDVCDFVGTSEEEVGKHAAMVHPLTSEMFDEMQRAGNSRHGRTEGKHTVYIEQPRKTFVEEETAEDLKMLAGLGCDVGVGRTDIPLQAGFEGFKGGESGGAGASGSWDAPPLVPPPSDPLAAELSKADYPGPLIEAPAPTNGDLFGVDTGRPDEDHLDPDIQEKIDAYASYTDDMNADVAPSDDPPDPPSCDDSSSSDS
jgi:hypothetical protein